MIVTIHQPDFLPWLGFFDRWAKSDLYIVLDDVQFLRRGWHNRDKIKTKDGVKWLTVPVVKKGLGDQIIRDVRIDYGGNWHQKHLGTIAASYKKAPHFDDCYETLCQIFSKKQFFLFDLNMDLLRFVRDELGITSPLAFASDYKIDSTGSQRLLDLVKGVSGSAYLTGDGSKAYLDEALFSREKIQVVWQEFEHPVYNQLHGRFVPMLSVLDFLMMRDL
jgi:hypothetical protein